MDSNKKPGTEAERRLYMVANELDETVNDSINKCRFILIDLIGCLSDAQIEDQCRLDNADMLADIALDYLERAQSVIGDIIIRERRGRTDE